MATTTKARQVAREAVGDNPILRSIMRLAGGVLSEMIDTPGGAEMCAKLLRDNGWTCTAPRAAKKLAKTG